MQRSMVCIVLIAGASSAAVVVRRTVAPATLRTRQLVVLATQPVTQHSFDADVSSLLGTLINSIYPDKETPALRELLSNAADAIDRRRFISNPCKAPQHRVRIRYDGGVLAIEDTGAGMTRKELETGLGRIGGSETTRFATAAKELRRLVASDNANELTRLDAIGRFGVGFYAAFLLASVVTVVTLSVGASDAVPLVWQSSSLEGYTLRSATEEEAESLAEVGGGTRVVLKLRPEAVRRMDGGTLAPTLRRFTPMLPFPVELRDGANGEWTRLNPEASFWTMEGGSADDAEEAALATRLYRTLYSTPRKPFAHLRLAAEGVELAWRGVLFLPPPGDSAAALGGLAIYCQGALVGSASEVGIELPSWCRDVALGVVDVTSGLSLTVDRQRIAPDAAGALGTLRNALLRALPALVGHAASTCPETYATSVWFTHGRSILAASLPPPKPPPLPPFEPSSKYREHRLSADMRSLCLFRSVRAGDAAAPQTLAEHLKRARANGQPGVLYGDFANCAAAEESALCEGLLGRGWDVVVAGELLSFQALEAASGDGGPYTNVAKALDKSIQEELEQLRQEEEEFARARDYQRAAQAKADAAALEGSLGVSSRMDQGKAAAERQARVLACLAATSTPFNVRRVALGSDRLTRSPALLLQDGGGGFVLELNPGHPLVHMLIETVEAGGEEELAQQATLLAELGAVSAGVGGVSEAKLASRLAQLVGERRG